MLPALATSALSFVPAMFSAGTQKIASLSPGTKKAILIVFIVIVLYFTIGKKIIAWVKNKIDPDTVSQAEKEIDKDKLTYETLQYKAWADGLQQAMENDGVGTDEDYIYNVFGKMKTEDDIKALIKSFGKRTYYNFFLIPQGDYNLIEWLQNELDSKEMQKLNSIIESNLINFTF